MLITTAISEEATNHEEKEELEIQKIEVQNAIQEFENSKKLYELAPKEEKQKAKENLKEKAKITLIAQIEYFSTELKLIKNQEIEIIEIEETLDFFAEKKAELEQEEKIEKISEIANELRIFWQEKSKKIMANLIEQNIEEIKLANEKIKEYTEKFSKEVYEKISEEKNKTILTEGLSTLQKNSEVITKIIETRDYDQIINEEKIKDIENVKEILLVSYELMAQLYYGAKEIQEKEEITQNTEKAIKENSDLCKEIIERLS
ncbi:MAG: hypothetical protein QXZ13_01085 [Candidatus Diapherotrites archaeon]